MRRKMDEGQKDACTASEANPSTKFVEGIVASSDGITSGANPSTKSVEGILGSSDSTTLDATQSGERIVASSDSTTSSVSSGNTSMIVAYSDDSNGSSDEEEDIQAVFAFILGRILGYKSLTDTRAKNYIETSERYKLIT